MNLDLEILIQFFCTVGRNLKITLNLHPIRFYAVAGQFRPGNAFMCAERLEGEGTLILLCTASLLCGRKVVKSMPWQDARPKSITT